MELTPGTVIDRYTVDSVLGEGGMAVVYRVRHNKLGTVHALKVLSLTSRTVRERLVQEGRVQAQLSHPNVVSVTDVIDVGGAPGLIMEYVRGPDLDALLGRQRLSLEQADALAIDIMGAVAAAHKRQLIHRDLKPANVILLITPDGLVPKITDFGLAKLLDDEGTAKTRTGATMGTPQYMSPEQIRDAKHVGPESDVFSLGAILYELVTGQRAFQGPDLFEVFRAVAEGLYTPPRELVPDLPDRMERAIIGALQVDLDLRIPTVDKLLAVWKGELDVGEELVAPAGARRGPWTEDIMAEALSLSGGEEEDPERAPSDPTFGTLSPASTGSDSAAAPEVSAAPPGPAPRSAPSFSTEEAGRSRGWLIGLLAAGGGASLLAAALVLALGLGGLFLLRRPPAPAPVTVASAPAPAVREEAPTPTVADPEPPAPAPVPAAPVAAVSPAPPPRPPPQAASQTPDLESDGPAVADVVTEPPEEGKAPEPAEVVVAPEPLEEAPAPEPAVEVAAPEPSLLPLPPDLDPEQTRKPAKRIDALVDLEPDPGATRLIAQVMRNDPDQDVRDKAWRVIRARHRAGTGSRAEHEQIITWVIEHGPASLRREALMAMGRNGTLLEPIATACASTGVEVRGEGLRALGEFAERHPERRGEVVAILEARQGLETDPDLGVLIGELLQTYR